MPGPSQRRTEVLAHAPGSRTGLTAPAAVDTTTSVGHAIWNLDGSLPFDWATFVAALTTAAKADPINAIR
ncbi:hypothetical protein [Tabrizicola sp.]|uniref:hypothetical protein n=1 Tax=Tabrizicola sp. TaxID=2005166 RepID=UPI003F41A347